MRKQRFLCMALLALGPAVVLAQSGVDPDHSFAWSENLGWTNWYEEGDGGVYLDTTFLWGFIWAENVGWINVGDGTPDDGVWYGNGTGEDFGVNLDPATGELFGLAWGENVGWINFEGGALADPPQPARLDWEECRLRGFAWGENVGWINLDDAEKYVAPEAEYCEGSLPGDCDGDGDVDLDDLGTFAQCITGPGTPHGPDCACADIDGDEDGDLADFAAFQLAFGQL